GRARCTASGCPTRCTSSATGATTRPAGCPASDPLDPPLPVLDVRARGEGWYHRRSPKGWLAPMSLAGLRTRRRVIMYVQLSIDNGIGTGSLAGGTMSPQRYAA